MHHYIRWQLLNTFEQLCFAHGLVDFYDSQVAGGTKFYPVFGAVADGGKKSTVAKEQGSLYRLAWGGVEETVEPQVTRQTPGAAI